MYGTIARIKIDPARLDEFRAVGEQISLGRVPGQVAGYMYQMDSDPGELFLVAVFESREAYKKNAASPEQNERYMALRRVMLADPEWHDGEILTAM